MRKRITIFVMAALTAMAMMAAPASAHPHGKAANGFVGPDPSGPGGGAHNGIECAALANKNITSLAGVFECPSPNK